MKDITIKKRNERIGKSIGRIIKITSVLLILFVFLWIYRQDQVRAQKEMNGLSASPILVRKEFDYGESGFRKIAENENFMMYTDFTTGEVCIKENGTGYKWYSNPQDREEDNIIPIKSNLSAQFYLRCIDLERNVLKEENNYAGSIQKGCMEYETVENGVKYTYAFPTFGVVIPVQYTLNEDGFLAEIVTEEIEEQWKERYVVESIALMPWFGAGGLEDDGYLFVPDGSGALINFNNEKNRFRAYMDTVYGSNLVEETTKTVVKEQILMPVFGMRKNDNAFLGVITSGESSADIQASCSKKGSSYNYVYPSAVLRDYLFQSMDRYGVAKGGTGVDYTKDVILTERFAVQYFFLDQDHADYSGMSSRYREYLLDNGRLRETSLADKNYVVLDLYGAVSVEKYVMGVKKPVVTALTTYEDVRRIVKELKAEGVENLIINYVGALESGLNNEIASKVSTEPVLGSKREFQEMIRCLEEENVILFLETNPIDLHHSGNGYSVNGDSVKGLYQSNAYQYQHTLDSLEEDISTRWRLMQPGLVPEFVENFVESAGKQNVDNISLNRLGEVLYADYSTGKKFTTRRESLQLWENALATAAQNAQYLMVHKGNVYCSPYADVISDVSTGSSQYDMADGSIPFYQMVLRGSSVLTSSAINAGVDYNASFLKAQELGCSLKYNLIAGDPKQLVGTEYNYMVSYSYDYWKDIIVDQYHRMQEADHAAGKAIICHEFLAEDVVKTEYESGVSILVNYSEVSYTYEGHVVDADSYLVIGGDEK